MNPTNILQAAAASPHEWLIKRSDFENTLSTSVWETVKDAGASAAVGSDAQNGTLVLTSAATTDNDGALVQSINEFFKPTSGKRAALSVQVKNSDADQTDLFFGLAQTAATDPEAILAVSNRAGFQINDGDASILLKSELSDAETSVDSQLDLSDDTYVKLSIAYDGNGRFHFYIDDVAVGVLSTNIPATELGIALFHLSGSASGTRTSTWKNLHCVVEL